MINHEHKLIFIHIPKCAGSSVVKLFNATTDRQNNHRTTLLEYKRTLDDYDDYYKFTIVRNPWDKVVSEYNWFTNTRFNSPPGSTKRHFTGKGFEYFVDNFWKIKTGDWSHRREQITFIKPEGDLDKIIRFENLSVELPKLCNRFNVSTDNIPHKYNLSMDRGHYTEHYNDRTREIVADKHKHDIEYFKYTFDGN